MVELIERRTQRVFGDGWHFSLRSFLPRHIGTNGILPWHIDADAAQTSRAHCINVWLPLDAVGTDRPSVDVILGSHIKMRDLPLLPGDIYDRDETFVASIGPTTSSGLNPGDALVFDHYTSIVPSHGVLRSSPAPRANCAFSLKRRFYTISRNCTLPCRHVSKERRQD